MEVRQLLGIPKPDLTSSESAASKLIAADASLPSGTTISTMRSLPVGGITPRMLRNMRSAVDINQTNIGRINNAIGNRQFTFNARLNF
jgi:hypothetical protein